MLRPTARTLALSVFAALTLLAAGPASASALSPETGKVRFINEAHSGFDRFTDNASVGGKAFMRNHYYRQKTYAPYFDSKTSWYGNAWAYKDLYAAYKNDPELSAQSSWILKDSAGRKLFIPWGCSGGTCPQYAADVGNPAYRSFWIAQARKTLASGYRGLFIDDANMELRVGNGNGDQVAPTDPRTGQPMTPSAWRRYVADFLTQIRAAFPGVEIAHNAIWFAGHSDPDTARGLLQSDWVTVEHGVSDDGLTNGGGKFGFETLLKHIDWIHSHGKAVLFDAYAETRESAEYNLATYFLVNGVRDGLRTDYRQNPDNWWSGYDVNLGAAQGGRYKWHGLLRRDFGRGYVLVNQPGSGTRTVATPGAAGPDGSRRPNVTLAAGNGAVIVNRGAGSRNRFSIRLKPFANPSAHAAFASRRATSRQRIRRAVLIRGRIRSSGGSSARGRVRMAVTRRQAGRWVTVRRVALRSRSRGRISKLITGLRPGVYRVRASYSRGSAHKVATSPARRFNIRH